MVPSYVRIATYNLNQAMHMLGTTKIQENKNEKELGKEYKENIILSSK